MQTFVVCQDVRVLAHRNPRFVGQRANVVIARPQEGFYLCGVDECGAMGVEFASEEIEPLDARQ